MRTRHFACFATMMLTAFAQASPSDKDDGAKSAAITAAARQVWAITDLVLEKDIDPPARQQMLLHGLQSLLRQRKEESPANLAQRVSTVTTPEQFAALLAEVWPAEKDSAKPDNERREHALFDGLLAWRMSN